MNKIDMNKQGIWEMKTELKDDLYEILATLADGYVYLKDKSSE